MSAPDWTRLSRLQGILLLITLAGVLSMVCLWRHSLAIRDEADQHALAAERIRLSNQAFLKAMEQAGLMLSEDQARLQEAEVQFGRQLLKQGMFSWTRFLNDFEETVSSGISILSIELNAKDGGLHIKGHAVTMTTLTGFAAALQGHPLFSDVILVEHAEDHAPDHRDAAARYLTFHMSMNYRGVDRSAREDL
jgi:hypothetical protein